MRNRLAMTLFSALIATSARAQVQTEWWRTYAGSPGKNESAGACAIDAAGNVYVAGTASSTAGWWGPFPPRTDLLLVKYSPAGTQLWAAEQDLAGDFDSADACAVAPTGDVYVLGHGRAGFVWQLVLMKFTSSGALEWTRTTPATHSPTLAGNVSFDAAGNALLCGAIELPGTGDNYDAVFQSYSPAGALQWSTTVDGGAGAYDQASRMLALASGDILAVGCSTPAGSADPDLSVWKLSASGSVIWTRTIDGNRQLYNGSPRIAVSPAGKLLASGSGSNAYFAHDSVLAQLDLASGALDWTEVHDHAVRPREWVRDVAVDPSGVWWVTGGMRSTASRSDVFTRRYDSSGTRLSSQRWSASPDLHTAPTALVVGAAGQVWVAATGRIAPSAGNQGYRPFVIQYDANGNYCWEHSPGQPGLSDERVTAMQAGPGSRLALVGSSHSWTAGDSRVFATQLDLSHARHR